MLIAASNRIRPKSLTKSVLIEHASTVYVNTQNATKGQCAVPEEAGHT